MSAIMTTNNTSRRGAMRGLQRTPLEQVAANLENALRALAMAPRAPSDLCPHPLDIVAAEIRNAQRYTEEAKR